MVHVVLFSQNKPSSDSLDGCIAVVKWDTTVEVSREYKAEKLGVSRKNMGCWCPHQDWGQVNTHDEVVIVLRLDKASPATVLIVNIKLNIIQY